MNTKFIYNRKSKLNTNGMALIQLQIIGDRLNRPLKSTRIYIEPQFWDEKRQIVKKKHPEADFLNKQLKIFQKK
ncbi:MAG: Arm DNA-binding domain-containing protein, partial [Putridiphycobacter sp.]